MVNFCEHIIFRNQCLSRSPRNWQHTPTMVWVPQGRLLTITPIYPGRDKARQKMGIFGNGNIYKLHRHSQTTRNHYSNSRWVGDIQKKPDASFMKIPVPSRKPLKRSPYPGYRSRSLFGNCVYESLNLKLLDFPINWCSMDHC